MELGYHQELRSGATDVAQSSSSSAVKKIDSFNIDELSERAQKRTSIGSYATKEADTVILRVSFLDREALTQKTTEEHRTCPGRNFDLYRRSNTQNALPSLCLETFDTK